MELIIDPETVEDRAFAEREKQFYLNRGVPEGSPILKETVELATMLRRVTRTELTIVQTHPFSKERIRLQARLEFKYNQVKNEYLGALRRIGAHMDENRGRAKCS